MFIITIFLKLNISYRKIIIISKKYYYANQIFIY